MSADGVFDPQVEDEMLQELLDFDPLKAAEDIRGTTLEDDTQTSALGFRLMQNAHQMREEALMERGDTTFRNDVVRYLSIIQEDGFEQLFATPFLAKRDGKPEMYYVYFNYRDGILLAFDTYQTTQINGGTLWYNWVPRADLEPAEYWRAISSGHYEYYDTPERVWVGNHDCREALMFNLGKLRTLGTFVTPWRGDPRIWLNHHGDSPTAPYGTPEYQEGRRLYEAHSNFRITTQLPLQVLEAIGYCEECGTFDRTVVRRNCGYQEEVSGRTWAEVVCDACEVGHNREI